MRTIVTVIFIFAFLSLTIVGENVFSYGFCDEFEKEILYVISDLKNGEKNIDNKIDNLVSMWENQKKSVFVFADHKNFQEVESCLYSAKYCIKSRKTDDALFHMDALYNRVKEFEESIRLNPGNLF